MSLSGLEPVFLWWSFGLLILVLICRRQPAASPLEASADGRDELSG